MTMRRYAVQVVFLIIIGADAMLAQRVTISGQLLDEYQRPVARANIVVSKQGRYVADDSGRFSFGVQPGRIALEVRRLGFQPTSAAFSLDRDTVVTIAMISVAQSLPEQRVLGAAIDGLSQRGFYDRMRDADRGLTYGFFITPEDIDARRPFRSSQMLERVPGIRLAGTGGNNVIPVGQNGCPLTVYLDGARLKLDDDTNRGKVLPGDSFDGVIGVTSIAGIEIYPRGTRAPARFQLLNGTCGIIAVWTK